MSPLKLVIALGTLGLGALGTTGCVEAEAATSGTEQEIIGGQTATSTEFPTVVALEDGPGQWFCTGTLIDPSWVLTAAHCVKGEGGQADETAATLKIRFDDTNINDTMGGHEVAVAEIHADPTFNFVDWDNDIALIKLATPVTDREPSAIQRGDTAFGTTVIDVGYGASSNSQSNDGSGRLRKLTKVTADCAGAADPGIANANLICMNAADGKGSCFGDSGGPTFATVNGKLVVAGVTSGGSGDTCGAGWDLYTSVRAEIAFVDATMGVTTPTDPTMPGTPGEPGSPGTPGEPGEPTMPDPTPGSGGAHLTDAGGCNTSGQRPGSFAVLAALGLVGSRWRRRSVA